MTDLPRGWAQSTIGEVADVGLGRQRSPKNHTGDHMRPYLRSANVTWDGIDLTDVKEMNFDPDDAKKFELQPGDLVLNEASGSPNEVGKPAIWNNEIPGACFQNTLLRVQTRGPLTKFLYWYCYRSALLGEFGEAGRGVNIRHLGKRGLADFPIPFPPFAEQERIVAAIEEHFSHLDAAEASVASAVRRAGQFRRALLRLAFTEGLHGEIEPGHLRPLVEGLELLIDHRGKTAKKLGGDFVEEGVRVISAIHIKGGEVRYEERHRFVTPEIFEKWMPDKTRAGDVLLTSEAPLGQVAQVQTDEPLVLSQRLYCLRGASGVLDNRYLRYFLESPVGQDRLVRRSSGTTVTGIRQRELRQVVVPIPPVDVQERTVVELETHLSRLDAALEVAGVRNRSRTLRRAVLAAAFSGQLVPQDPANEPASVLLDRIRAEAPTTKSTRKKKPA